MLSTRLWSKALITRTKVKLIDANVFIYAAGVQHPLRRPCIQVLEAVAEGILEATTDVEVFQEILNYYQREGRIDYGAEVFANTIGVCPKPVMVSLETVRLALDILRRHATLQARDAVHAAVIREHGLEGIISADQGFDKIDGLKRFDPKEFV